MIIRIALVFFTINLCFGKDNDLNWTLGFYLAHSMKNICAVRGCTKSCKKEYMIGSMFGREYFCKEHYDEILATFDKKGDYLNVISTSLAVRLPTFK